MSSFPFPHDLRVYVVADDHSETAYYAYNQKKYKRAREIATQTWQDTTEQEIDSDLFWLVVGWVERRKRGIGGLVGLG